MSRFRAKKESLTQALFSRGEGGIKRALRALLPGSAKRRQEDGHAQHAFKARLSLTKALLKVKPVDDSTGFRERRRRDLNPRAGSPDLHP